MRSRLPLLPPGLLGALGAALVLTGCERPAGEAVPFPPADAPDHEVVQALVTFDEPLDDSTATAFAVRHSLEPWGAELELAEVSSTRSVEPERAGLRFLDRMQDELRSDLRMTLCALPDRAAHLLEVASADSLDLDRARGLVERADRVEEALAVLAEGDPRYVRGMRVSATVADVRRAAAEPAVESVRRASTPDGEEDRLAPAAGAGDERGERTPPETAEARTRGEVDPARIRARLQSVARGYEGCGVSGPRS